MSGRLRVALDVTPLVGPPSGIHQVTRGLLEALKRTEDLTLSGWMLSARGAPPDLGIPVRRSRFPARLALRMWSVTDLPRGRFITGSADVVHGTNFVAPAGAPRVISVQDLSPVTHPEWCRPEVAAFAGPLRRAVDRGAMLHASCAAVAAELEAELGADPGRVAVVHHGVPPVDEATPGAGRALAGTDRYVLVLGTVETRKDVGAVTAALPDLPDDVRVVIAGPRGNAEQTIDIADRRIVRIMEVDPATRAALLRDASVLAFPSRYEGFGLPPLEAISVGTPVVATAVGALPELLGDHLTLVPPGDHHSLAEALATSFDSPPVVTEAARQRVARLTWEASGAAMVDLYRRVVDES